MPTEQIAHCSPREFAGTQAIARDSSYGNVTLLTGSLADFRVPEKLDNTDDDHKWPIFDPNIRGRTDQVLFRFRKPQ
jgi:hypothetical protein